MPYATVDNMVHRFDERLLKDLVRDDGQAETNLSSNEPMQVALMDAAGEINSAVQAGKMYDPDDLADPTILTGDDRALLVRLNCELAMLHLVERRQWQSKYGSYDKLDMGARGLLDQLRKGQKVFNIAANINAGVPSHAGLTRRQYEDQRWARTRYKGFYPSIELPVGRG